MQDNLNKDQIDIFSFEKLNQIKCIYHKMILQNINEKIYIYKGEQNSKCINLVIVKDVYGNKKYE